MFVFRRLSLVMLSRATRGSSSYTFAIHDSAGAGHVAAPGGVLGGVVRRHGMNGFARPRTFENQIPSCTSFTAGCSGMMAHARRPRAAFREYAPVTWLEGAAAPTHTVECCATSSRHVAAVASKYGQTFQHARRYDTTLAMSPAARGN